MMVQMPVQFKYSSMIKTVAIAAIICLSLAQQSQAPGILETKRIAFGASNAMIFNTSTAAFALNFQRPFSVAPRIGLAVYTMDFEYSPTFSCRVTNSTTSTSAVLQVTTSNVGQNNQLFLMYMATDHPLIGIFMPPALTTNLLNQRLQTNNQSFQFNYKQEIIVGSLLANIRLSVFMTGISMTSELTNNGYSINSTYFRMEATKMNLPFYNITIFVQSSFGDITIAQIQYTVVYFDVTRMSSTAGPNARYLIDSGTARYAAFGGTATPTSQATTLALLNNNGDFEGNFIFYGISTIHCSAGPSIVLSGYPTIYNNSNTNQFILNAQTWKLAYIFQANYEYIQYQTLKCNLPLSNCDSNCNTSPVPHFIVNGICQFCQYSCLTCDVSASVSVCDTCHTTRQLNPATRLCDCQPGYYDPFRNNYTCVTCFPCQTCAPNSRLCLTCDANLNLVLNTVLSTCQCIFGFYPNYNSIGNNLNQSQPCLPCPPHCLLCSNASFCLACDTTTYLTNGSCFSVCSTSQFFNTTNQTCLNYTGNGALFDQSGRLGYDFTYQTNRSVINFTMTFSQSQVSYYYYQNQTSYSSKNSTFNQSGTQAATFFYDDGNQNINGFQSQTAKQAVPSAPIAAISGNSSTSIATGQQFDFSKIKISDLNSSYLGISEQYYYYLVYQRYQQSSGNFAKYTDNFGIPYGKVNLSTSPPVPNPHFADALSQNLVVTIGNDTVQPKVVAASGNQFHVTSTLSRSYFGETATLELKNAGLVRNGNVSSQMVSVAHPVYIYVCTVPSDVSLANSLYDSNRIIVGVLWGLCKYPLFVGLGWIFMPLMLTLMSIMNLNYIDTQRPLNLDLFLASFADFRNPSILYNPARDNMDTSIFSHPNAYKNIPVFNRFDRGIDFMKNSFQFFFVPFLAVVLLLLLYLFNKLLNAKCKKDIPFISHYLVPRFPLLIGAYTLVQALPVTFFFFAQLNDTRSRRGAIVSSSYAVFNVAMSFIAFFLTFAIPLALMSFIYYKVTKKDHKVESGSQLILMFTSLVQAYKPDEVDDYEHISDPLWTQKTNQTMSYGFAISVFYLFIVYGFFTSFFFNSHAWQLAGLITATVLFGFFAYANKMFTSVIIKAFWIIFSLLMLAFLLLLAALGSNVTTAPCGLENLGYLAIGFLYALIIMALIASIYLLWFTLFFIYSEYCKGRPCITDYNQANLGTNDAQPQRLKTMREQTNRSKLSKSHFSQYGSRGNLPLQGYVQPTGEENMNTSNRLRQEEIQEDMDDNIQIAREQLRFDKHDQDNGDYIFVTNRSNRPYRFDSEQGQHLYNFPRLYIDPAGQITDGQNRFIHRYEEKPSSKEIVIVQSRKHFNTFAPESNERDSEDDENMRFQARRAQKEEEEDQEMQVQRRRTQKREEEEEEQNNVNFQRRNNRQLSREIELQRMRQGEQERDVQEQAQVRVVNRYLYNGEQYEKVRDMGNFMLARNIRTGQTLRINQAELSAVPQNQLDPEPLEEQEEENVQVHRVRKPEQRTEIVENNIDQALINEIENNQVAFSKNHKFIFNGEEYTKLAEEGNLVRLYHNTTKKFSKVSQQDYLNRILDSLQHRVNFNGKDYNIEDHGANRITLVENYHPNNYHQINQRYLNLLRQQNQNYIRTQLYGDLLKNQKVRYSYNINDYNNSHGGRTTSQQEANQIINRVVGNNQQSNQEGHQVINRVITNNYSKPDSHQIIRHNQLQQPQSASYANNLLLLQSKATKNQEPVSTTTRRQVVYVQDGNNGQIRTSQQEIRTSQQEVFRPSQHEIIRPSQQEVRTSQQSISEYKTNAYRSPTSNQYIEMQSIKQESDNHDSPRYYQTYSKTVEERLPSPRRQEEVKVEEELDPDTIEYILANNPGPFQMYVMGSHQVQQVNGEDVYERSQALERKIIFGRDVMGYMREMEQKIPNCIIFMVDMSNEEEYRIN